MSVINVSVSGGSGSTTTATTGDTVDVVVGNLSVGTLPALQIAAGTGIAIATSNGVSTISTNLSTSVNLADLADVQSGASSGQVLAYNGTDWNGVTLSLPSNLSDLANVQGTPTAGQVLAWNGTAWSPADDQTGGSSDVANLADLSDVSATSPSSGQALTWDGSQWAAANVPVGTTINGLSGSVTLVAGDNINVSADGQNITIDTIGQASVSNLTDLVDVNSTMSPTSGQALVWNGSEWTADSVTALVSNGTTLDLGTGKILYSNVYDTPADLPTASDYHGMFVHVHDYDGFGTGAAFYAHAGNWVRLADSGDVPTTLVSTVNGLSGALVLSGGPGISISQSSSQLTISSTATSSTINGQTGPVSFVGGNRIDISTSGGTITASANLSGYLNWSTAPQNSSAPGSEGDVAYNDNYFFVRTSQGWRRTALSAWNDEIAISSQPQDLSLTPGGSGNFTVTAAASDGSTVSYQWQNSDDNGVTWDTITGSTAATYGVSGVSLTDNGTLFRVVLSAANITSVTSDSASLTVAESSRLLTEIGDTLVTEGGEVLNHDGFNQITITQQPQDVTANSSATFSVSAIASDGSPLTYQWQKLSVIEGWQASNLPTQEPNPFSQGWSYSAYAGGLHFVFGYGKVAVSSDGFSWSTGSLPVNAYFQSVAYGGGVFVAVASNYIIQSTDGVTWSGVSGYTSDNWIRVAYGGGRFVAISRDVGGSFAEPVAVVSEDGSVWSSTPYFITSNTGSGPTNFVTVGLDWNGSNFVASGYGLASLKPMVAVSQTGATWVRSELGSATGSFGFYAREAATGDILFTGSSSGSSLAVLVSGSQSSYMNLSRLGYWFPYHDGQNFGAVSSDGLHETLSQANTWQQQPNVSVGNGGWGGLTYGGGSLVVFPSTSNQAAVLSSNPVASNIVGANSETLNLAGLAASENGSQYRVIVDSATAEAVASSVATLTVT